MAMFGYSRVSTLKQNEERQDNALLNFGVSPENIKEEKKSGKNLKDREILSNLLNHTLRQGDTLVIESFSRLARNTKDLLNILEILESKEVKLISLKEDLKTDSAYGKFMVTIIGAMAEFEREMILERQREGIAIAKAKGKFAKPKIKINKEFKELYDKWKIRELSKVEFAKRYNVSRPTLNRLIKEYEEGEEG